MTSAEFLTKKRAVFTGLEPIMSTSQLMQAMILWENKYAHDSKFALANFVAELCQLNGKTFRHNQLLVNLVQSMALPADKLLPDPSNEIESFKQRHQIKTSIQKQTGELVTFQLLVKGMLSEIRPSLSESIRQYAVESIQALDISNTFRRELTSWLKGKTEKIQLASADVTQLRAVVSTVYVAVCEYLGPVKADSILAEALESLRHKNNGENAGYIDKLL